jgi:hypothetical protein
MGDTTNSFSFAEMANMHLVVGVAHGNCFSGRVLVQRTFSNYESASVYCAEACIEDSGDHVVCDYCTFNNNVFVTVMLKLTFSLRPIVNSITKPFRPHTHYSFSVVFGTEHRGRVVSTRVSYSEGPRFKSRPGGRLF